MHLFAKSFIIVWLPPPKKKEASNTRFGDETKLFFYIFMYIFCKYIYRMSALNIALGAYRLRTDKKRK